MHVLIVIAIIALFCFVYFLHSLKKTMISNRGLLEKKQHRIAQLERNQAILQHHLAELIELNELKKPSGHHQFVSNLTATQTPITQDNTLPCVESEFEKVREHAHADVEQNLQKWGER